MINKSGPGKIFNFSTGLSTLLLHIIKFLVSSKQSKSAFSNIIEQDIPEIVKESIKSREQVLTVLNFTKLKYEDFYNLSEFKVNLPKYYTRNIT